MNKPHKHAEAIKAWADGLEIEYYQPSSHRWIKTDSNPLFSENIEYRIKQEPKLVPFTFEDAKKLIGKSVIRKESGSLLLITRLLYPPHQTSLQFH